VFACALSSPGFDSWRLAHKISRPEVAIYAEQGRLAPADPVEDADVMLRTAEDTLHHLRKYRVEALIIGAVALTAHRYVR